LLYFDRIVSRFLAEENTSFPNKDLDSLDS